MNKYILSFILLLSCNTFIFSMQEPGSAASASTDFDDNQPFTPQAIHRYNLPRALLQALERPHVLENYADNLKDIRSICVWFYEKEMTHSKDISTNVDHAVHCFDCKIQYLNPLGNREDWTPHKINVIRVDILASARTLLQRKLHPNHDKDETRPLLHKDKKQ